MKKSKFTGEQIAYALRQAELGVTVAEVCRKMGISEATFYRWKQIYGGMGPSELRKIKEIAETRVRYGYRRIHVLLRREGWAINVKRVHRLYRMEGLNLRSKRPRRHVMEARRVERPLASRPNKIWAMDFVSDALFNGKRFRALTVVDAYTRECLAIHADQGIKGEAVATVMERLTFQRGTAPAKIRVDNVLGWEAAAENGQQVSLRRW